MILDSGIVKLIKLYVDNGEGNMPVEKPTTYYTDYYGERTVGMSRYYAAQQANSKVDKLIRINKPPPDTVIAADDVALLSDEYRYRIVQAQEIYDEDAGADVVDLSLERIGYRDGNNKGCERDAE